MDWELVQSGRRLVVMGDEDNVDLEMMMRSKSGSPTNLKVRLGNFTSSTSDLVFREMETFVQVMC